MTVGLKTVLFAINLFCLFGTILYPSDITPISLLPCWIGIGYWLYEKVIGISNDNMEEECNEEKVKNNTRILFIILLIIFVLFVVFFASIGFFCEYDNGQNVDISDKIVTNSNTIDTDDKIISNSNKIDTSENIPSYVNKEEVFLPFKLRLPYWIFQLIAVVGYVCIAGAELIYLICKQNKAFSKSANIKNGNTPSQEINRQW